MVSTPSQGLATRTLRGMGWAYGSYVGLRLTTLVATAILARLLTPRDFGLVAIATTVIAFLDVIQGLGVSQALVIAGDGELEDQADTAFTLSVSVGVVLTAISAALGPAAAKFFHEPLLVAMLPVLGSTFFILGISSTHYALAMRSIDFRSRTFAELTDAIVRGVVGISLALTGAGVWSLILGYVAGNVAMAAILWRLVPWRPRRVPSFGHARGLLHFGGYLTGVGVMAAFLTQFDNLVVGRVLGPTQLGYYSIATKIPSLFILNLAIVAGQVLFPAFAALDADALRRGIVTSFRYMATIVFPLTAFLIVLAEPITIAVFGPHWHSAVAAARVLSLWALMSPISMICGNAFMSRGRARLLFLLAIPQAVALVVGSIAVAPQGIVAVSWVQAAIAIVAQAVTLAIATRMFSLSTRSLLGAFVPPLIASAGTAGVLVLVDRLVAGVWLTIAVGAVGGGLAYFALLHVLAPDLLPGAVKMLLGRGKPQPS
jgi:O-antigen/teichoic acid export membrane protein